MNYCIFSVVPHGWLLLVQTIDREATLRLLGDLAKRIDSYERVISSLKRNLPDEHWTMAKQLLGWMVCAKRPLKKYEIYGAISFNSVEETIFSDEDQARVEIGDVCGSLVQMLPGGRVVLVHSTART